MQFKDIPEGSHFRDVNSPWIGESGCKFIKLVRQLPQYDKYTFYSVSSTSAVLASLMGTEWKGEREFNCVDEHGRVHLIPDDWGGFELVGTI